MELSPPPELELEPLLLPDPELLEEPELEPLELELSSPASLPPLLLPEPVFEDEEQAFVPMVPMPPIANRQTQKASFFMSHPSPR
jgi:hypothetical protein